MAFELFSDLLDRSDARPAALRRPLVAIALIWLVIIAAFLLLVPGTMAEAATVARAAVIALVAAVWWWAGFELLDRFRRWLRGHPELGDRRRLLAYFVAMTAYLVLSFAVLVLASR